MNFDIKTFNKDSAIKGIYIAEGGDKYTNDPSDKGGETRWGITKTTAYDNKDLWAKHNFTGDMRTLPEGLAYDIYAREFWDKLRLDDVMKFSTAFAYLLFSIGVNSHPRYAGVHLQRSLNLYNNMQTRYKDLTVDGNVGPMTIKTLEVFFKDRGKNGLQVIFLSVLSFQMDHYANIAERNEEQEKWSFGWANRMVEILAQIKSSVY